MHMQPMHHAPSARRGISSFVGRPRAIHIVYPQLLLATAPSPSATINPTSLICLTSIIISCPAHWLPGRPAVAVLVAAFFPPVRLAGRSPKTTAHCRKKAEENLDAPSYKSAGGARKGKPSVVRRRAPETGRQKLERAGALKLESLPGRGATFCPDGTTKRGSSRASVSVRGARFPVAGIDGDLRPVDARTRIASHACAAGGVPYAE